jgi:glycosyltransferase involved in cell wall biosynthesis
MIVANSPGGAEYWEARGVPSSRIEVIPNFVPREEIESAPVLQDARVAAEDDLVLHVGRLSPDKNLPMLIAAMGDVCRDRPQAKLALCGEGPLLDTLVAQVRAARLGDRIVFAGFVPNVPSWLKRARAVIAVSECEGHPNAVLEAMAAGVPVVVSDIPAYRHILDDSSACFTPGNDSGRIAAAIEHTLEHRRAALERAARARTSVTSLTLRTTVTRYESVYQALIVGRTPR